MKQARILGCLAALGLLATPVLGGPPSPTRLPVYFAENDSQLSPEAKAVIDEAAATIQKRAAKTMIIVGIAENADERLSEERASAVADELIAHGVARQKISLVSGGLTASLGGTQPPFANRTAEIIIEPREGVGL